MNAPASLRGPTLHDVAARAGVSHQTVSRVVNGSGPVRPATRDRIASAIDELGYRGNLAARMLATRRSRAIGVLAPETNDFGPTSTIHALEFAARESGYRLLVTTCRDAAGSAEESLTLLLQQNVEAIVLVAPSARMVDLMSTVKCPILPLQQGPEPHGSLVYIDQFEGVRVAVEHLIRCGHRRIQMVLGPAHSVEARQRREAFESALRSAGVPAAHNIPGDWTARAGYAAADAVDAATTAVFCANDQMALGLISGLLARGTRVPADVSVVGFDDVPEAAYFAPPLTTVQQDFARVGSLAIEQLTQLLAGGSGSPQRVAPVLIERESVAASAAPRGPDSGH